jgi:hypothetical protein
MTELPFPDQLAQLEELLRQRFGARLRDLSVTFHEGRFELRGTVVSYHTKQLAQHVVVRALGTMLLVNRLVVRRPAPGPGAGDAGTEG